MSNTLMVLVLVAAIAVLGFGAVKFGLKIRVKQDKVHIKMLRADANAARDWLDSKECPVPPDERPALIGLLNRMVKKYEHAEKLLPEDRQGAEELLAMAESLDRKLQAAASKYLPEPFPETVRDCQEAGE